MLHARGDGGVGDGCGVVGGREGNEKVVRNFVMSLAEVVDVRSDVGGQVFAAM